VIEALQSVLNQHYSNIELIVIDDASTDNSVHVIESFLINHQNIRFIKQDVNTGNCEAFNTALRHANGNYIIDLAADDILLPERISQGVETFAQQSSDYGINFTDAEYINKSGDVIKSHYLRDTVGLLMDKVPQGEVFKEVLQTHFICSPTTLIKKDVFDQLGGYDGTLAYEDFDLWVRASRSYKFCYTDQILVQKRILSNSLGQQQYRKGNNQMVSTYQVCLKAHQLCRNKEELRALRKRIQYELKHAIWLFKISLSYKYAYLWIKSL
jgi:glycosyltransferase involved in cell wall biosynthesis